MTRKQSTKNTNKGKKIGKPLGKKGLLSTLNKLVLWLAAIGLLPLTSAYVFDFITGDVDIAYSKPVGRGYEFRLINKSSTAQRIESFRITPDFKQQLVFKITDDVIGTFTENGVSIPGGNITYMPAYEFKELDGYLLAAKSEMKFRVPPLVARAYMQPEAVVVFVQYKTRSNNRFVNMIEKGLTEFGLRNGERKRKYLVAGNYWTPMSSDNITTALQAACRDNDLFSQSSVCKSRERVDK